MLKKVEIHPHSYKAFTQGHFWITPDRFSLKFPTNERFLLATFNNRDVAILLNDPEHKDIKARLWQLLPLTQKNTTFDFYLELKERFFNACKKRLDIIKNATRENLYLIFGEGDHIPGLFIQKLNDYFVFQVYTNFWHQEQEFLQVALQNFLKENDIPFKAFFWQNRGIKKSIKQIFPQEKCPGSFIIKENQIKLKVDLFLQDDFLLYTDMAAIREWLTQKEFKIKSCLNLFSYTGAFSLWALDQGADEVVSVDLSQKYLDILDENINLNNKNWHSKHLKKIMPTSLALKELCAEKKEFDFIICDPPSAYSDGQKKHDAFSAYKSDLPAILTLIKEQGVLMAVLNTHTVSKKKFLDMIESTLKNNMIKYEIIKTVGLLKDCPVQKGFYEGDYLKIILIKVFKKGSL